MITLTRLTPPAVEPVSLAEMKEHSRIDGSAEDGRVLDCIRAAAARLDGCDGLLGRALITQTWQLALPGFPFEIAVPLPPLQAVTELRYRDPAGALQTLPPSAYAVHGAGGSDRALIRPAAGGVFPETLAQPEAVLITFRAGYGDAPSDVPEPVRAAIRLHAAHLYEHRESVSAGTFTVVPHGYHELIADYRLWGF